MATTQNKRFQVTRTIGQKRYEFCDHLSNVRNIITDTRKSDRTGTSNPNFVFHRFATEDVGLYNMYAYGMPKTEPNDYINASGFAYRYGFNGQEKVDEIAGVGNHNSALYWEYDTRLGRRWNVDPVDQIDVSNYAVMFCDPINISDEMGDKGKKPGGNKYNNPRWVDPEEKTPNAPTSPVPSSKKSNEVVHQYNYSTYYRQVSTGKSIPGVSSNWADLLYLKSKITTVYYNNQVCSTFVESHTEPEGVTNSIGGIDVTASYNSLGWNDPNHLDYNLVTINGAMLNFSIGNAMFATSAPLIRLPALIHTGRTTATTIEESLAMATIKENPKLGQMIIERLGDKRLLGYSKFQYNSPGRTVSIHFVAKANKLGQPILGTAKDFKFAPILPKTIRRFW
jgi:hypothetical protein